MLNRVIAFIRTMMGGATPTQPAGPALQEPTTQTGKVTSALDTKPHPQFPSPVAAASSKKRKPAQRTTAALKGTSKKQKPAQTGKSQSTRGSSTPTPASKTRQHVKQAAKSKR